MKEKQHAIKSEAERRKLIKNLSADIKKLQKKIDAFTKSKPDDEGWAEWEQEKKIIRDRNKMSATILQLENHPVQYEDLRERLKAEKKKELTIKNDSDEYRTIIDALDKASKYNSLRSKNNSYIFKEAAALIALTDGKGTASYTKERRMKNLRKAARIMGWTNTKLGKKSLWPPGRLDYLKEDYLKKIGPNPSQEEKKLAILEMYKEWGCVSSKELSRNLYKAGLSNIPRFDYTPKK